MKGFYIKEKDFDISLLKTTNLGHYNSLQLHKMQHFPNEHNIYLSHYLQKIIIQNLFVDPFTRYLVL